MRRLHLVAAAVANCVIVIIVAVSYVMIRVMQQWTLPARLSRPIHFQPPAILLNWIPGIALGAGFLIWLVLFLLRQDGTHRLAALQTTLPRS
jgi:hypothetical protein